MKKHIRTVVSIGVCIHTVYSVGNRIYGICKLSAVLCIPEGKACIKADILVWGLLEKPQYPLFTRKQSIAPSQMLIHCKTVNALAVCTSLDPSLYIRVVVGKA